MGGVTQIRAELTLYESALNISPNNVIHLLSGQDLPIKSQEEIHHFIDDLHPGKNFIGFASGKNTEIDLMNKTSYYHPYTRHFRHPNLYIRNFLKIVRIFTVDLQKIMGVKRKYPGLILRKGCNWATITPDFARYLVDNKKNILKMFSYTWACDEIYKQTLAWSNPGFRNTIYNSDDEFGGAKRLIDWQRGTPYVFRKEDFDELKKF